MEKKRIGVLMGGATFPERSKGISSANSFLLFHTWK
jgi:hypothetical protein